MVPETEEALCEAVAGAERLRVVGGGHSFNAGPLCDQTMVSLDALDKVLHLDPEARIARVQGGIRLRDLNRILWEHGLGLPVLGSTDTQSIAGLVSTDLHGTGRDHGFLSERIRSLRVVDARGEARTARPDDPLFHAAIGAIGTCGVICEVELQLDPAFYLAKDSLMVDRRDSEACIEALLAANDHVSFYYVGGGEHVDAVRVHTWNRVPGPPTEDWARKKTRMELQDFALSALLPGGAELLVSMDEDAPLSDALAPDTRLVLPGSVGFGRHLFYRHDEIEYGVPFEAYRNCLGEVMDLLQERDFLSIVEVRFTPDRSQALLGPGVGRRTAYIELATPLSQDTASLYPEVEEIFLRHGGQPHLGKKTTLSAHGLRQVFGERFEAFQAQRRQQDPEGTFLNAFTSRLFAEL